MFNKTMLREVFIAILNAITYGASQALSSGICVCSGYDDSYGRLCTALNEALDMAIEADVVGDIDKLYDKLVWLEDANYCDDTEVVSDNIYSDICCAILYSMSQCYDSDINVCGFFNESEDLSLDKQFTMDMLMVGYYYVLLYAIKHDCPVKEEELWQYDPLLLEQVKRGNLGFTVDAWYLSEKARLTADVSDALALVDLLHDQSVLSSKIEIDIG